MAPMEMMKVVNNATPKIVPAKVMFKFQKLGKGWHCTIQISAGQSHVNKDVRGTPHNRERQYNDTSDKEEKVKGDPDAHQCFGNHVFSERLKW